MVRRTIVSLGDPYPAYRWHLRKYSRIEAHSIEFTAKV